MFHINVSGYRLIKACHTIPHSDKVQYKATLHEHIYTFQYILSRSCHPHFKSSWQLCDAWGIVVHKGSQVWLGPRSQPHSLGGGSWGDTSKHFPQQWPAWYVALFACCRRASAVRGMDSISLLLRVKWSLRAALTVVHVLVRSYIRTVKRSRTGTASVTAEIYEAVLKLWKTSVSSSYIAHASHAVFLQTRTSGHIL